MEERQQNSPRRFYRDTENGIIFGVCAGIADYFGFRLGGTRWVVAIAVFFMPALLIAYIAIAVLVPPKPMTLYKDKREEKFWRSVRRSPQATLSNVRHKFREIEVRMQRMERYVTSSRFNLDQEFRNLEDQ